MIFRSDDSNVIPIAWDDLNLFCQIFFACYAQAVLKSPYRLKALLNRIIVGVPPRDDGEVGPAREVIRLTTGI